VSFSINLYESSLQNDFMQASHELYNISAGTSFLNFNMKIRAR